MDILRTPFYQDVPQAFLTDFPNDHWRLVGPYGETIKNFAKYYNYELHLLPVNPYKTSQVQKYIEKEIYNVSMHGGVYQNVFANISFSYPVEWTKSCIIVSAEDELPRYWYLVWPFGRYIWTILFLSIIYVAVVMQMLKHPSRKFPENILKSLAVISYSSNMNLKVINVPLRLQLFYCVLLIMGFILSNYYLCYLTTYNMKPIFQPYPRNEEDMLKSNMKVWVSSQILEELNNSPEVNLTHLESVLVEKSLQEVSEKLINFSRSLAYVVTLNDWEFMEKLQRHLIQPLYRISDICFGDMLNTFPIQSESKFAHRLNQFILLVQQSGLWNHWHDEAIENAVRAKYFEFWFDAYPVDPLNLYYYRLAWIMFGGGIGVSCICLVMEIVVHRYRKRSNNGPE